MGCGAVVRLCAVCLALSKIVYAANNLPDKYMTHEMMMVPETGILGTFWAGRFWVHSGLGVGVDTAVHGGEGGSGETLTHNGST